MPILAIGISHRRAPVELLERLAFADEELPKAYRRALDDDAIEEAVILSTCNRVEIYGSVPAYHAGLLALKRLFCEPHGSPGPPHGYPLITPRFARRCTHS